MLFPGLKPKVARLPENIDLRCCDVAEVLAVARGARLVIADPPWQYSSGAAGKGMAQPEENGIYGCADDAAIVGHLDASYECCDPDARLAVWYTWPKDAEWYEAGNAGKRWGYRKSGGSWTKMRETSEGAARTQVGVGYHWRGQTEPVALFVRGSCGRTMETLYNGHVSPPGEHSYKPVEWQRAWIRAWTSPGDLVLDLYAGLGSVAIACALEGRRYIGAEIDPERHRRAGLNVVQALEGAR